MGKTHWLFHSPNQINRRIRDRIEVDNYGYQSRLPGGVYFEREPKSTIGGTLFAVGMAVIFIITYIVFF